MRTYMLPLSAFLITAVFILPARAQELSSSINPFKQKPPQDVTDNSLDSNPNNSNKSLWPKLNLKPRKKPGQPSAVEKLSRNTKQFMKKSQQTLLPWTKPKKTSSPITGLREKSKPTESWNPLSNLFKPAKDEVRQFETANDWFAQPRPEFYR